MSLTVTQRPNQNGVWIAAKNPVIYKMTRNDFTWTTLVNSAGNTSIQISGDVTASFITGDIIWLQSNDGAYSASGTVASSSFSGATTVIINVPYVFNNSAGYINLISRRPNYYIGVDVYSTFSGLIGTVNYYPSMNGLLIIDVSQPLFSVLSPEISSISDEVIFEDTNSTEGFYIKYTEFWTGSSNSAIDDSGNTSYAILGAKQVGQDSYYAEYTNLLPLTKMDKINITIGEYYCLSWIFDGITSNWLKKSYYNSAGTLITTSYVRNISSNKSIYTFFEKFTNDIINLQVSQYLNFAVAGGTQTWGSNTLTIATGTQSKVYASPYFVASGVATSFTYNFVVDRTVTVYLFCIDSSGASINGVGNVVAAGTYTTVTSLTPLADAAFVGLAFLNNSGANATMTINSFSTPLNGTVARIDFKGVRRSFISPYPETTTIFNTISGYISTCSSNPVTLMWRNSIGGESSWVFGYSQDQVQKLQDPFKNNWLTLYEKNLTIEQFNALNELFSVNQVYQTPIIELTTDIDKTEARVGQQVYMVDTNGNKVGVIVIGGENKTRTRNNRHNFQVTIELPEIFG